MVADRSQDQRIKGNHLNNLKAETYTMNQFYSLLWVLSRVLNLIPVLIHLPG